MFAGEYPCVRFNDFIAVLIFHDPDDSTYHPLVVHIGAFEPYMVRLINEYGLQIGDIQLDEVCILVCRPHGTEYLGERAEYQYSLCYRPAEFTLHCKGLVKMDGVHVPCKFGVDPCIFGSENGVVIVGVVNFNHNQSSVKFAL